jgi:ketosteroid isomerase-like protein
MNTGIAASSRFCIVLVAVGGLSVEGCASGTIPPASTAPAAVASPAGDASCVVWDREVEFARSVKEHDAGAFAEHVHPGAAFVEGDGSVLRGRDAVSTSWAPIVRGDDLHLEWYPTSVIQTGARDIAISRGPYWVEVTKPDAKQRFLAGVFQSIWVRDTDGAWRVLVDGGTPSPRPATEADIARLKSAIPAGCPRGS